MFWSRRYKERKVRLYFRGDAAFASPEIYEYLEAEGLLYVIRLKANARLPICLPTCRSPARPCSPFPRQLQLQEDRGTRSAGVAKVEWHPGERFLASALIGFTESVTNLSRPTKRVVACRGTAEQHIKEGKNAITGPVCHVASSATMPFGSSFTPWPTIWATS